MKTYNEGPNTRPGVCRNCGQQLAAEGGITYKVWGYPWDGSDTEGSISQKLDEYIICAYATDCARRIVEQGSNIAALRTVARDRENLGELADQAREILRQWSEMAQAAAHADDLVAREAGWGVIGGPAGLS